MGRHITITGPVGKVITGATGPVHLGTGNQYNYGQPAGTRGRCPECGSRSVDVTTRGRVTTVTCSDCGTGRGE
ncbi:MAG TPA: hypothetical protein VFX70_11785 [Mycobacteriales bacterium]|nr:hypothetical protein [Mycobacteriales bacterium]